MRTLSLALLATILLAGCAVPLHDASPAALARDAGSSLPPARGAPSSAGGALAFTTPIVVGAAELGAEPDVVVGGGSTAFIVTPGSPVGLYRTTDAGYTWQGVGLKSCVHPSAQGVCEGYTYNDRLDGGGDASVAILPNGSVAWLGLLGSARPIPFQISYDNGTKFTVPRDLSQAPTSSFDREWITAGPDGTLYAIWRDTGAGAIYLRTTADGGASWSPRYKVSEDALLGELVVDPVHHALFVPEMNFTTTTMQVARSLDGGATWSIAPIANPPGNLYFWPAASVDASGNLYVAWSENANAIPGYLGTYMLDGTVGTGAVYLARSADGGATFGAPTVVSTPGKAAVLPWVAAGATGKIAIAYYESTLGVPNGRVPDLWNVVLLESLDATSASPTYERAVVTPQPSHVGAICVQGSFCSESGGDRSLLDFMTVRILADGQPILAWGQDNTIHEAITDIATARATSGPSLR